MLVCRACKHHGVFISKYRAKKTAQKKARKIEEETEIDVVEDYNERIRKARKEFGMEQEDLAKKVNEKLSVIKKIEQGKMKPPEKLAKKLEKLLKIELLQTVKREHIETKLKTGALTLGDIVKIKKK